MNHIYLSPHADDALLSCGGAIHRQARAGDAVRVITFFAGDPPGGELSPFALEQHHYWGRPPRPMALRRAEDAAALVSVGADVQNLGLPDAVYRAVPGGRWPYNDLATLLGEAHPQDPVTARDLAGRVLALLPGGEQATLYAPLGVGAHVDHQIVHRAARDHLAGKVRLAFYEDYPYAETPGATEAALRAAEGDPWPLQIVHLDPEDVTAKVLALGYYRTQLSVLFDRAEAMPSRVWAFAARCCPQAGLAERIWWHP